MRAIRDPIHGNIPVKDVTGAVIDTLAFQRLRYVRQNGLLHFVFPGATHTRFAHSIGAMHVATRVWDQLAANFRASDERDYIGIVFELAALLHDVGHCAFSHSIETIKIGDKPLLGTVREVFETWNEKELLGAYLDAKHAQQDEPEILTRDQLGERPIKHEPIGLMLAKQMFSEPSVDAACRRAVRAAGSDVATDVIALMQLGMPATHRFETSLAVLAANTTEESNVRTAPSSLARDLRPVLAGLISGTLDVDRMDYLLRDSFYCGVSYGRIDLQHIVASLGLATDNDRTFLTIKEKAVLAVDDLLWSRHQMFLQVYGHKTNAALNRTLELALPEAMGELPDLDPPRTSPQYLEFIDDFVLSKIFSVCFRGKKLGHNSYARLLARREVPEHLGEIRLSTASKDTKTAPEALAKRDHLAQERGVAPKKVLIASSDNELIKKGPLPHVYVKRREGFDLLPFREKSSLFPLAGDAPPLPPRHAVVHFFIDRHDVERAVKSDVGPGSSP